MSEPKITLTWGDQSRTAAPGLTLEQLRPAVNEGEPPIVAAIVNNLLRDLRYPVFCDSRIEWLNAVSPLGSRIVRNSLALLLSAAAAALFPEHHLRIEHSLRNGRFCRIYPRQSERTLTAADIMVLEREMRRMAEADLPIRKSRISKPDAVSFCKITGDTPKSLTLDKLQGNQVTLYSIGGHTHHLFSKTVPSTGYLQNFRLCPFEDGFILVDMYNLSAMPDGNSQLAYPKTLNATLDNYSSWINMQSVNYCSDLNHKVETGDFSNLVVMAEARQERQIQQIADRITQAFPTVRLVLIAGPSSSGKTSFCNRLAIELRNQGLRPITLSMDNYFRNNEDTPLLPDGQPDFEGVAAVDTELFNRHLKLMLAGEAVEMPVFDFKTGRRSERTIPVQLGEKHILLVEGIHGLNEALTAEIPAANKLKIYISCMTALNLDNLTPISTSDNREIRRLVRDVNTRNISAEKTLLSWQRVRKGEENNIFPYQDSADCYFNTSLIYEFSLLAPLITPYLQSITADSPAYAEARRLLRLTECFVPADAKAVPAYSLLQEFLGGSIFEL